MTPSKTLEILVHLLNKRLPIRVRKRKPGSIAVTLGYHWFVITADRDIRPWVRLDYPKTMGNLAFINHEMIRASREVYDLISEGHLEIDPRPLGENRSEPDPLVPPAEQRNLSKCRYVEPQRIKGSERVCLSNLQRWEAAPDIQIAEMTPRLIAQAQRILRELPVCPMTGKFVEIRVTTNLAMLMVEPMLYCPKCGGK